MSQPDKKTIDYWAANLAVTEAGNNRPLNFWDVPYSQKTQRMIAVPDAAVATIPLILNKVAPGTLKNGLSIGSGSGHKELELIKSGAVEHFTLVEIVPELIAAGIKLYAESDLLNNVWFVEGDFRKLRGSKYDLIYFDSALHHMQNVEALLIELIDYLNPGGYFVMDDFVGPTYNQFPEEIYAYADHIRHLLPESFFNGPDHVAELSRIPIQDYLNSDPSEACDSGSILPALAKHMPGVEITPTGGLVYYLACRETFHKFRTNQDTDEAIIRMLFELDRVLVKANPDLTCYALAIWQKPEGEVISPPDADWKNSIRWPDWRLPL